jgi:hypothetical protein
MSAITGRRAALARADDCRDSLSGCRFLDDNYKACGRPQRARSSYCPHHHAVCYLPIGSEAERQRIRMLRRIAAAAAREADSSRGHTVASPNFLL